jgi:hypothetical protein
VPAAPCPWPLHVRARRRWLGAAPAASCPWPLRPRPVAAARPRARAPRAPRLGPVPIAPPTLAALPLSRPTLAASPAPPDGLRGPSASRPVAWRPAAPRAREPCVLGPASCLVRPYGSRPGSHVPCRSCRVPRACVQRVRTRVTVVARRSTFSFIPFSILV